MRIGLTKIFFECFNDCSRKNGILGEAIIKALLNLKNESKTCGLNVERLAGNDFWSARVTRDYRIIFYQERDIDFLLYLGSHKDAYKWANKNKTIHYKDYLVGYWDSSEWDNVPEIDTFEDEYSCFDKEFQARLLSCTSSQEILKVCEGLAPEYKEIVISHNSVNLATDNYSSEIIVVDDDQELTNALEKPFEEWMVFLHPIQKKIIDFPMDKNLSIRGGPGTGKTVSLVHRYVRHLEENKNCLLISKSEATISVIKEMVFQLKENASINYMLMSEINEDNIQGLFKTYDYFFFDELQDIGRHECQLLVDRFKQNKKHFTIAYDLNQAVYTVKNKKEIFDFEGLADETIILTYNYRCTSEIFRAAANFIRFQYDRLKKDTFEMDFALMGNDIDVSDEDESEIDVAVEEFVVENNLLRSGDWAIIFTGYFNRDRYISLKRAFPDNVFTVVECKGMDFKAGCVVIYNEDFSVDQKIGFREFNAESYVAITRFRDFVKLFYVHAKYERDPQKITTNIHSNALYRKEDKYNADYKEKKLEDNGKKAKQRKLTLKIIEDEKRYDEE